MFVQSSNGVLLDSNTVFYSNTEREMEMLFLLCQHHVSSCLCGQEVND